MPRDGSNIYSQPFPDVVEDTTIESTVYNGFTNDVAQDLNAPRPVTAGGTGGSSATDARFNLATEVATQLVTNYDDHLWVPGSFRSTSSATNPPVASHSFAGWCYINEALTNPPTNQNVVIHAYDFDALATTSLLYTRQKKAGVWSNWSITTTEANQAGARQAIYAAPFDALAYNGMQVNGSMEVSQEIGTTGTSTHLAYICDAWRLISVLSPGVVNAGATSVNWFISQGIPGGIYITVPTAKPALGASDVASIQQNIEGYRISRLGWGYANAQSLTIGFWSAHSKIGTYSVTVRNATAARSYAATYTQNVTGVTEYKTITIPGCVDGTWDIGSSTGIILNFTMACGTSNTASSANTWLNSNYTAAPGQVNGVDSVTNVFRLGGVVVIPGTEAPSAARSALITRPYDQELITCQRYYHRAAVSLVEYGVGGTAVGRWFEHPVHMRAVPVMTSVSGTFTNSSGPVIDNATNVGYRFRITVSVTGIGYVDGQVISADARL